MLTRIPVAVILATAVMVGGVSTADAQTKGARQVKRPQRGERGPKNMPKHPHQMGIPNYRGPMGNTARSNQLARQAKKKDEQRYARKSKHVPPHGRANSNKKNAENEGGESANAPALLRKIDGKWMAQERSADGTFTGEVREATEAEIQRRKNGSSQTRQVERPGNGERSSKNMPKHPHQMGIPNYKGPMGNTARSREIARQAKKKDEQRYARKSKHVPPHGSGKKSSSNEKSSESNQDRVRPVKVEKVGDKWVGYVHSSRGGSAEWHTWNRKNEDGTFSGQTGATQHMIKQAQKKMSSGK